jgi:polyisoprenoid-binding protein YceI
MKKINRLVIATFIAATVGSAAFAAPVNYTIDAAHTFPRFSYEHFGFSTQLSRFDKTTGTVVYDAEKQTGSVDIAIDIKSVNTGSTDFNGHIQGEDFLDSAKFPQATFKSTKVTFTDGKLTSIDGNLTIKGVTKPVTLTVTAFKAAPHPMLKKPAIGAVAFTTIKRSEFNAGKYVPYVGDDVRIDISFEAQAQ